MLQSCCFSLYRSINQFFLGELQYLLVLILTTTSLDVPELYWDGVPPGIPKYHRRRWAVSLCVYKGATSQWGWSSLLTLVWPLLYANWPVCHSSTCMIYYINNISTHLISKAFHADPLKWHTEITGVCFSNMSRNLWIKFKSINLEHKHCT